MEIEVLGSGGSLSTPKIFCNCPSCREAREKGTRYSRLGPSLFVHGPDILIDTPEEISIQINRSSIRSIEAFSRCMGVMDHFNFMEHQGVVKKQVIGNDEIIELNGYNIQPVQLAQDYVFGYKIFNDSQAILVIMDELKDWIPSKDIRETDFDIVYLPFGIFNFNPITGSKTLPDDYFLYEEEATIDETLSIIKLLKSKQFILSHIEEPDNITLSLAESLEDYYSDTTGRRIRIAYDTMKINAL